MEIVSGSIVFHINPLSLLGCLRGKLMRLGMNRATGFRRNIERDKTIVSANEVHFTQLILSETPLSHGTR